MYKSQEQIIRILIERGNEILKEPYEKIEFTKNTKANNLLNDLTKYPHAFVLGCVMDRQIKAEKAWLIPYEISTELNGFRFSKLQKLNLKQTKRIFKRKSLHRFNDTMAECFYLAVQKIHNDYNDNASKIWANKPKSSTVVRKFLQFKGVGLKIATMAANSLARDFKIPMKDYICIDISPDVHVQRVFKRLGFIPQDASNEELVYSAKELNPEYPGIFDLSCWEIGRSWCKSQNPNCEKCYLEKYCLKII